MLTDDGDDEPGRVRGLSELEQFRLEQWHKTQGLSRRQINGVEKAFEIMMQTQKEKINKYADDKDAELRKEINGLGNKITTLEKMLGEHKAENANNIRWLKWGMGLILPGLFAVILLLLGKLLTAPGG